MYLDAQFEQQHQWAELTSLMVGTNAVRAESAVSFEHQQMYGLPHPPGNNPHGHYPIL